MEQDIGLLRAKGSGISFFWKIRGGKMAALRISHS
jgi:hypothetical protein